MLTTKNKYSNLSNRIESFFNKKDVNESKKSSSPRRNIFEEKKSLHLDIRSVDRQKPVFNYKNSKPNSIKIYTKASSPRGETPRQISENNNKIVSSTKNKSKDHLSNEGTFSKDKASNMKEKIFKFCKNNNFEIKEVISG